MKEIETSWNIPPYRWHVRQAGERGRPVVLFLHGFMGSAGDWREVFGQLAGDFYCIAIDLPGHGKTRVMSDSKAFSMAACARGIRTALLAEGLAPCHLAGYSMGGRLALYFAVRYPQIVQSLVLESASPGLPTAAERRDRRRQDTVLGDRLLREDFAEFLQAWYRMPLFGALAQHPTFPELLQRRQRNEPAQLRMSLQHMGTGSQPSLWRFLPALPMPVLLLAGEGDTKFVQINQRMAGLCPQATLRLLSGCSHAVHVENTTGYAEAVGAFLAQNSMFIR